MNEDIKLWHGDCLELMNNIPDKSVDMICTDLPYGTTACSWDSIIPFDKLWKQYNRIIKDNGAICLFGSEPFSSMLRMSNLKMYRYDWIWEKSKASNFLQAKKQPLKAHETISVFGINSPLYNPIMSQGERYNKGVRKQKNGIATEVYNKIPNSENWVIKSDGLRYPRSVQYFKTAESEGKTYHPTQKPVSLIEYLINTYSNEGDLILDNTAGSMTTAIAAINTNRRCICIEKDDKYFEIGSERVRKHLENKQLNLF